MPAALLPNGTDAWDRVKARWQRRGTGLPHAAGLGVRPDPGAHLARVAGSTPQAPTRTPPDSSLRGRLLCGYF